MDVGGRKKVSDFWPSKLGDTLPTTQYMYGEGRGVGGTWGLEKSDLVARGGLFLLLPL